MERGFPIKCVCGGDVVVLESKTQQNPGRPFFRCATSREVGHLFKWVEDGTYEETVDLVRRVEPLVESVDNVKLEMEELNNVVSKLREQVQALENGLEKVKICSLVLCFAVVVVAICKVRRL